MAKAKAETAEKPVKKAAPKKVVAKTEEQPAKPAVKKSKKATEITNEMIAARAYEIFLQRGGTSGDENSDWFQAEAELKAGK